MELLSKLKQKFAIAPMLMKFIYINIGVFVILRLIGLGCLLFNIDSESIFSFIEVPSSLSLLATRPWTLFTYMFAQYDILHILFNMLWLYWFGAIFMEFFTPKQFCGLYILGGLGGAALYIAAYNIFPYFAFSNGFLLGASASVIAIVIAISLYMPNYKINLLFFGPISLSWIAAITIFIDIISIDSANAGGHIAHLGGATIGILYALAYKRGKDITLPINTILDFFSNLFKKPRFKKPIYKKYNFSASQPTTPSSSSNNQMSADDEQKLDTILDKIKKSGYSALTDSEKKMLFDISRKKK